MRRFLNGGHFFRLQKPYGKSITKTRFYLSTFSLVELDLF